MGMRPNRVTGAPGVSVLPFTMTGSAGLLEAVPRHQTAHGALLGDILDVLRGSSPTAKEQSSMPPSEELSPGELTVLRYLPTNLSLTRDLPANCPSR